MARKKSPSQRARAAPVSTRPASEAAAAPPDALSAIRGAELDIVNAVILKARQGSYVHAKFLFDYAGMSRADGSLPSEPSLAQVLLQRLGLDPEMAPEPPGDVGNVGEILVNGEARG